MEKAKGVWCPSCHMFREVQELYKSSVSAKFDLYSCGIELHPMLPLLIIEKEVTE